MNRRFHLYPDTNEQQRLRLSMSLVDIHKREGFEAAINPFEVAVQEVDRDEQLIAESWQELTIRPPIPRERIAAFGESLVNFANSEGLQGAEEVLFIDHTMSDEELLRDAITRKVGGPAEKGPSLKDFFAQFGSRDALEQSLYGRILSADDVQQRIDHLRRELEAEYHLTLDEIDEMLAADYALVAAKCAQEAKVNN